VIINEHISNAEEKWLKISREYLEEKFRNTFLPSHDLKHHLRTWGYARSILIELSRFQTGIDDSIAEAALLATLFHDTGMIQTHDSHHGEISKKYYLDFLKTCKMDFPALHDDILQAIEIHDHKDEYVYTPFSFNSQPDILTLTSIADDMDALGTIGIYRYAEIYMHRHINHKSLGVRIMENASTRFNNFSKASMLLPGIVIRSKVRYQQLINFYDQYNQQILLETDPETVLSGHIGVINYINEFCVRGTTRPENIPETLKFYSVGNFITDFFADLSKEL